MMTGELQQKIDRSIQRLRSFEPQEGYFLAFSGGKDSVVIKALADRAGVKYDAHYSVTTVDPPELVRFIKQYHPDVIFDRPQLPMRKLIPKKKTPPTRRFRYCCQVLKQSCGIGRVTVTGVRWAESVRRAKTRNLVNIGRNRDIVLNDDNDEARRTVQQCYRTKKTLVNPIVDWTDNDVWSFIKQNNIPYCSLYDEGFDRIGCIGCPLAGSKNMRRDFERWPAIKKMYLAAFADMLQERRKAGKINDNICKLWGNPPNPQGVMRWWLGEMDGVIAGQMTIDEFLEEENE